MPGLVHSLLRRAPLGLLLSLAGCSTSEPLSPVPTASWDRAVEPPSDAKAEESRAACVYAAGALAAETQGKSRPNGAEIPVDHIVIVMQENRSFDHYFQKLPEYGQPDADVAPDSYSNPGPDGKPVTLYHATSPCTASTPHSWTASHNQFNGGEMDGFVKEAEGESEKGEPPETAYGERAVEYYDAADLPFYYWLASEFALADRYHASLLGPTWPNRMFFYAASSYGRTSNVKFKPDRTIFDTLAARGVDFKLYFSDTGGLGDFLRALVPEPAAHIRPIEEYFTDAKSGSLPAVAFVNSTFDAVMAKATWEHAPNVVTIGQRFVADVVDALARSPAWSRSAMFLTYDEHGGLFDHVPPPPACLPDEHEPEIGPDEPPGGFDQLGMRVPMMVISPFAKKHYVGHRTYDHTSIVRFIEARFVLPALTGRDANAEAQWDLFDFGGAPHAVAPAIPLPDEVDPKVVADCVKTFPPKQ